MEDRDARLLSWADLHAAPRVAMSGLDRDRVPANPGVFALYRDDRATWLGKSANLHATLATLFVTQGVSATSLVRRTVAAFLGIGSTAAIAEGRYRPTAEDHARINAWIRECAVSWYVCASESEAVRLEARLAAEPEEARHVPRDGGPPA